MDCSFLRDTNGLPSVFGFDVAVNGILKALLQHSTFDRFTLFHPPGEIPPAALHSRPRAGTEIQFEPTTKIQPKFFPAPGGTGSPGIGAPKMKCAMIGQIHTLSQSA